MALARHTTQERENMLQNVRTVFEFGPEFHATRSREVIAALCDKYRLCPDLAATIKSAYINGTVETTTELWVSDAPLSCGSLYMRAVASR